jgi:hypothetical protein
MRKALVVAGRELRERWLFFPAALVLGCVPLVLPAFGLSREKLPILGVLIALTLGGSAAFVAGVTMLARDTSTQRLGFLFSQPLPWPAIWGGKWLAAVVLGGVSGLLAAIPWMTVYPTPKGGSWLTALLDVQGSVFALSILVILIGVANLGATANQSRAPWVVVDLVMIVATVWGVRRYVPFLLCGASGWHETLLLVAPALALMLASAVQVALGRTDVRRAHRALSISFWACVLAMLLAAALYLHWIYAAGPGDLRSTLVTGADTSGRWIEVVGSAERSKCFGQDLLIDARSGRYLPLMTAADLVENRWAARSRPLIFAERAELAARWVTGADGRSTALELLDLSPSVPRVTRVTLEGTAAPRWRTLLRLSPSGTTALLVGEVGVASLFDAKTGRALATAVLPPRSVAVQALFLSETETRVWLSPEDVRASRRVLDLDTSGRQSWSDFALPVSWPGAGPGFAYALAPLGNGSRVLSFDNGVRLRDGRTGVLVATLVEGGMSWGRLSRWQVGLLADGRIVVTSLRAGGIRLEVFDHEGAPLRGLDLGPAGSLTSLPEIAPGRVAVGVGPSQPGQTVVVDIDTGRVVERIEGLRPAGGSRDGESAAPGASRPDAVSLFRGPDGQLVHLDFATGARQVLAGPGAPHGGRLNIR